MKKPIFKKPSMFTDPAPEKPAGEDGSAAQANEKDPEAVAAEADTGSEPVPVDLEGANGASEPVSESAEEGQRKVDAELVERLRSEAKENYDKYLRAVAELENFKKRAVRERADILKYAGDTLARDMLEIVDNFQLAMSQDLTGINEDFVKGIRMIYDRLVAVLEQHSVRGESSLGTMFDPNKQQALASVPTNDKPPGTVLEEFKRAYFFKDKLLRPGQVVVASADASEQPPAED